MDTNQQLREAVETAVVGRFEDEGAIVIVGDFVTIGEIMDEDGNLGLTMISDATGSVPAYLMLQLLTSMASSEGLTPIGDGRDSDNE